MPWPLQFSQKHYKKWIPYNSHSSYQMSLCGMAEVAEQDANNILIVTDMPACFNMLYYIFLATKSPWMT